jgi:hypothetical protein
MKNRINHHHNYIDTRELIICISLLQNTFFLDFQLCNLYLIVL